MTFISLFSAETLDHYLNGDLSEFGAFELAFRDLILKNNSREELQAIISKSGLNKALLLTIDHKSGRVARKM